MPFPTDEYSPARVVIEVEIYRPNETTPSFGESAIGFDFPMDARLEDEYNAFAESVRDKLLTQYPEGYCARIFRHCQGGQGRREVGELYTPDTA